MPGDNKTLADIESRIQNSRLGIIQNTIDNLIEVGDSLFEQEKYKDALLNYEKALKIDIENQNIIEKVKNTNNILNVLEIQKTEQSYSEINSRDFKEFRDDNFKAMNSLMKFARDKGKLNYTSTIKFDNLGNNQSKLTINSISDKKLESYLRSINLTGIPPSRILKYYIPSKEVLNFNLSWETKRIRAVVKSQKIAIDNFGFYSLKHDDVIKSFINRQIYKNGIYKFENVEKKLNGTTYEDLQFVSYNYNSGPMKFLYSMLLPGLGTKKVTDGKKGTGRMVLFLVSTAISVGSKIYSNSQYDKYKSEAYDKDNYFKKANIANKAFLISGGIAATIYINDILYVFGRGIKNNNKSRPLKKELKKGQISLVKTSLKP